MRRAFARLLLAVSLATATPFAAHAAAAAALAIAVMEVKVIGATCVLTSPEGAGTELPCVASGWTPALGPGWSAQMTATFAYRYADEGLRLPGPARFQLDPRGLGDVYTLYESAAIYASTSQDVCTQRFGPCGSTYDEHWGDTMFPPVFLSTNDFADDVSGEFSLTNGVRWSPPATFYGLGLTYPSTLFLNAHADVRSVAAIPEPSTWALMIGPLIGLAFLSRSRRR